MKNYPCTQRNFMVAFTKIRVMFFGLLILGFMLGLA